MPTYADKVRSPDQHLEQKAADALTGSVNLSNEVIGIMSLISCGRPTLPPGVISAMRGHVRAITAFIDDLD